jgi:hypothetical protein
MEETQAYAYASIFVKKSSRKFVSRNLDKNPLIEETTLN